MKKTTRRRRPVPGLETSADPATALPREDIARRAYEISLTRDADSGDPVADWLQAERELMQARSRRVDGL